MRREQGLRMQVEARVDWFTIFATLNRMGLSVAAVAEQSGVPRTTVLGWKQGAEPKHADGERVLLLWMRMTASARDKVPMTHCPGWLER